MADKNILTQMLEHLVNNDKAKAEELFHEYAVAKSREIYEGLIESEMTDDEDKKDEDDQDVEESSDADTEDSVEENFEEISLEADDADDMGGDPTDNLEAELDDKAGEEGEEDLGSESEAELFQDLDAIVDELQARFDQMKGPEAASDDMGGDEEVKDDFELETVREYVEKVGTPKGGDNGANPKSVVAGKNDMGGTAGNIAQGDTANDGEVGAAGGKMKGAALSDTSAKENNAGNINVPGGKAGNAFSKKEPGHGAEKAGAKEQADNKQSLFRGRR